MLTNITNPLLGNKFSYNLESKIKHIYFLLKKSDEPIDESIFYYKIEKELYDKISVKLLIYKIEYVDFFKDQLFNALIIPKNHLQVFNIFNYNLEEESIIIPCININYEKFTSFIIQFKINNLSNILDIIKINNYLKLSSIYIENIIKNLNNDNINYWNNKLELNLTENFKNRRFQYYKKTNYSQNNKNYDLDNIDTNKFVNLSMVLTPSNYEVPCNNINIIEIFKVLDIKSQLILFANLLITKKYCNLVINNHVILKLMLPYINSHYNIFKYFLGYTWISLYCDECVNKEIKITDSFIFDINTASLLPVYPILDNPKLNPYSTLLINNHELSFENNFTSIVDYVNYTNKGISNLEEFKYRLNLFCVEENYDIFENINFQELKFCICGSVMAACLQRKHPLLDIFNFQSFQDKFIHYIKEYYLTSDIDIMFNSNDFDEYNKNVNKFFIKIYSNINKKFNNNSTENSTHTELKTNFIAHIYISKYTLQNMDITIQNFNILKHDINFIELFKPIYTELIINEISNLSLPYDISNFEIKLFTSNYDTNNIKLNLKFKVISKYIKHELEIFNVYNNSFISKVSTFHLPCVRAYYDLNNVYLTPSCITAHLTYMNVDYKYIYSSQSPMEIIYKYRLRGFGTWLSKNEQKIFKQFIFDTNKNKDNIFGLKTIFNDIYKLNKSNNNLYVNNPSTMTVSESLINTKKGENNKNSDYNNHINFTNLFSIGTTGTIIPVKKWLLNVLAFYF